uniref:Uncharacterized protein n=1 Tax=Pseudomonas phage vB_PaeP_FBPa39 TaxID=3231239 RepID=A0AAU8KSU2_9VIRU
MKNKPMIGQIMAQERRMKRRVEKRGFNMSLQEGTQEPRGELGFTLAAVGVESSRSAYLRHARESMIQSGEPCPHCMPVFGPKEGRCCNCARDW